MGGYPPTYPDAPEALKRFNQFLTGLSEMETTKRNKHLSKLLWKKRNPMAEGTRFRTGGGRHGKDASRQRGNVNAKLNASVRRGECHEE